MDKPRISVIFSTFNRAGMLRQTLEAMTRLDLDGLDVEFVVVDNNSKDDTSAVIDSFNSRLTLKHLFEPRPGKNCALNQALDNVKLGEIVVFTDDDIVPSEDWLHQITKACVRWPDYSVFGGKIYPLMPESAEIPQWAQNDKFLRSVLFAELDLGDEDRDFGSEMPFGPNFWVRRTVFDESRRYNEDIGPRPGSYAMGSESSFLMRLAADGFAACYIHNARVGHHVQSILLTEKGVMARFVRAGKGAFATSGPSRPELLAKSKFLWCIRTIAAVVLSYLRILTTRLFIEKSQRVGHVATATKWISRDLESLKSIWNKSSLRE